MLAERIDKLTVALDRTLDRIEEGLVLTAVAVEMILAGLKRYFIGDL